MTTIAPFGTWTSPISASDAVAGLIGFSELNLDGSNLFWVELRPSEGGRQVLVRRRSSGEISDVTASPMHPRTLVHEYGGGSVSIGHGAVVFSEFADQRLYRVEGDRVDPVTVEPPRPRSVRFSDGRILPGGTTMVCVRESHRESGEAVNELVSIDLEMGDVSVLASGRDFYAAPRVDAAGTRIAWLEWDHPNMPWDGTELKCGALGDGVSDIVTVAGSADESVFQPEWGPDGELVFVSDRTGWWNLYRWDDRNVATLCPMDADFGEPAWVFGRRTFDFLSDGRIVAAWWEDGIQRLGIIGPDRQLRRIPDDLSVHGGLVTDGRSKAWFIGAGPETPTAIFELDLESGDRLVVRSNRRLVDSDYVAAPQIITFPTGEGDEAHGVFYPPANPDFAPPVGERPPLIVHVHGGPTSHVYPTLSASTLFWTSRGFAVVDVNYRGSSGYGRAFRNKLRGTWGLVDVEDSIGAATFLAERGYVDGDRLVITGGSAGGFTTLAALAFGEAFSAGASYFGVADIELLAAHTHKFESRYLDGLIGTDVEVMRSRSPLYSADRISVPVILFQGLEDKVVPPEQAESIANALHDNGVPYAHVTYAGEDHGFRKAENIVHSLESELAFYGRVFGFRPAGDVPSVPIVGDV